MKLITDFDIGNIKKLAIGKGNCSLGIVMSLHDNECIICVNKMMEEDDPTAHAAIVFTRSQRRMIRNGDLFELLLSEKPCPMCMAAIYQANIKNLYYINNDNKIKQIELNLNNIHFWYEEIHTNQKK